MTKELETEQHIKETAKRLFFRDLKPRATTQEIADAAGVNRALIHYYFRNRDNLFQLVLKEAMSRVHGIVSSALLNDKPFKEKIANAVEAMIEEKQAYPGLETFVIMELNKMSCGGASIVPEEEVLAIGNTSDQFLLEIEEAVEQGIIAPIPPKQFLINLMSLCSYPVVAKPILSSVLNLDQKAYAEAMEERKAVILKLLIPN